MFAEQIKNLIIEALSSSLHLELMVNKSRKENLITEALY